MLRHTVVRILGICGFSNYTFAAACFFYLSWFKTWFHSFCLHHLWRWNIQCVPKHRHIKFRRRGITQKKEDSVIFFNKVWGKGRFQQGCCKNRIKNDWKNSIPLETFLIRKIANVGVKWFPLFMKAVIQYESVLPSTINQAFCHPGFRYLRQRIRWEGSNTWLNWYILNRDSDASKAAYLLKRYLS
jgi:hypothetical protein